MALKNFLTIGSINQAVLKAEYAVRGTMVIRAKQIQEEILNGKKYPFKDLTECNIGNPQIFGHQPFSFHREVMSVMLNPGLLHTNVYHKDVFKRAEKYLNAIGTGGMGAYSDSPGFEFARKSIARYIKQRDGQASNHKQIFMTDGATVGLYMAMELILGNGNEGVMIPVPQYPLYTALLALKKSAPVPYYLNEEKGWSVDVDNLQQIYDDHVKKGINVKAMVVINPGNPTGQVLSEHDIQKIVQFAEKNRVTLLADEVYQLNIYKKGKKFVSFKKVISDLKANVDLFSFHSTSKGIMGECGIRGGYFEAWNIDKDVFAQLEKLRTMYLCPNTTGQILTELMVNPPNKEDCSHETVEKYEKEYQNNYNSLVLRAKIVTEHLNKMKNITCNEVEGAMYAFPRIHLPKKAIEAATAANVSPDLFYTMSGK
jgi:alanine transaminase